MKRIYSLLFVGLLLSSLVLSACGGQETDVAHNHPMADLAEMPRDVRFADYHIQGAYMFAVANQETADEIPCYCGCAGIHSSLYDCFVAGEDEEEILFDMHALYCGICVDIAQDTMRMMDEGKNTAEIFAQIETEYARFGPPTVKSEGGGS